MVSLSNAKDLWYKVLATSKIKNGMAPAFTQPEFAVVRAVQVEPGKVCAGANASDRGAKCDLGEPAGPNKMQGYPELATPLRHGLTQGIDLSLLDGYLSSNLVAKVLLGLGRGHKSLGVWVLAYLRNNDIPMLAL